MQLDKVTGSNMAEQMRKDIEKQHIKPHQQELLSAFYAARRDAIPDGRIPYATLQRVVEAVNYEPDHAISIIQQLDDKLIELQNERRKKEIERMKLEGAKR